MSDIQNQFKAQAQEALAKLTLDEKILLQTGADAWRTQEFAQKGVPATVLSDGPHGLRKVVSDMTTLGFGTSLPSVCFPTASRLANSFDRKLVQKVGQALGDACKNHDVDVLLGPGINIKRNSLCGRNFEYFSEDPYLSGELGTAYVNGVQSQGVGVSLKHFAANSQEYCRLVNDSVVDIRALNEIYLAAFKNVIENSKPWTVMCAYNKLNGEFCSENKWLITDKLRNEWKFDGLIMSDWGAVNNRAKGIKAGLDLQMPRGDTYQLYKSFANGELDEADLDKCVLRILELAYKSQQRSHAPADLEAQHELAGLAAAQSCVLAKNSCDILPLQSKDNIAVIGDLARLPHFQGGGSSRVKATKVTSLCDALDNQGIKYSYAEGYNSQHGKADRQLIEQAVQTAQNASCVVLVVGLTDLTEFEGYDRNSFSLSDNQLQLIDAVTNANANVIAVVQSGCPLDMQWQNGVKAVLLDYLGGQNSGSAIADILFGKVNPSGRLAETWAFDHSDQPSQENFANDIGRTLYKESIFVGYRYYDTAKVDVCFPFGFGLSYTKFKYGKLALSKSQIANDGSVEVSIELENIGSCDGAEVVQVYVRSLDNKFFHENKSLKGFDKIFLKKGESKTVTIKLQNDSFAYFNPVLNRFVVDGGKYEVVVAKNVSEEIESLALEIEGQNTSVDQRAELPAYYNLNAQQPLTVSDSQFEKLIGRKLPDYTRTKKQPHTENSTFAQIQDRYWGRLFYKIVLGQISAATKDDPNATLVLVEGLKAGPLRVATSNGFSHRFVQAAVRFVNGRILSGAIVMLSEMRKMKTIEKQRAKQKEQNGK